MTKNYLGETDMSPYADKLSAELSRYGLQAYMQAALPLLRHAVTLKAQYGHAAPIGGSKLGGLPDLPPDWDWPRDKDGTPLALLAQINAARRFDRCWLILQCS